MEISYIWMFESQNFLATITFKIVIRRTMNDKWYPMKGQQNFFFLKKQKNIKHSERQKE